jgi:hypothetical protein
MTEALGRPRTMAQALGQPRDTLREPSAARPQPARAAMLKTTAASAWQPLPFGASPAASVLPSSSSSSSSSLSSPSQVSLPSPLPLPSLTRPVLQRRAAGPAGLIPTLAASVPGLASTTLEEAAAALRPAELVTEAPAEKSAAPAATPAPDLDALVERACARMLETLSLEQERRGVTPWL